MRDTPDKKTAAAAKDAWERQNGDPWKLPLDEDLGSLLQNGEEREAKRKRMGENGTKEPSFETHSSPILSWLISGGIPTKPASESLTSPSQCQCSEIKLHLYQLLKQVEAERCRLDEYHNTKQQQYQQAEQACKAATKALEARESLHEAQEVAIEELKRKVAELEASAKRRKERHHQSLRQLEERVETVTMERESLGQAVIKGSEALRDKEKEVEALLREHEQTLELVRKEGKYIDKIQ